MTNDSSSFKLHERLMQRIAGRPSHVWSLGDFADLASRRAAYKALRRLTRSREIRRIHRGLQDLPGRNALTGRSTVPAKIEVLPDAHLTPVNLGKQKIAFKSAAPSKPYWAGRPSIALVAKCRERLRGTEDYPQQGAKLLRSEIKGTAAALEDGLIALPIWMQESLRPLVAGAGQESFLYVDSHSGLPEAIHEPSGLLMHGPEFSAGKSAN